MKDEEEELEELPEPSEKLTRPERWLAERLTPYRVFWIKRIANLLLIGAFIYASAKLVGFQQDLHAYHDALQAEGCLGVPDRHIPERIPKHNYSPTILD